MSSLLFAVGTRRSLRLSTGMLATVNLTLSMLEDPAVWLPAKKRMADEPGDDWTWTLRSAANRPILRLLGEDGATHAVEGGQEASRRQGHDGEAVCREWH